MDDETRLSEVDSRVRAALVVDPEATRRVFATALADRSDLLTRRWHATVAAAAVVFALGVGMWLWHGTAPPPSAKTSLKVTTHGSLIVVEAADGRRWIVGPPPAPRTGGNYVIVVPQ